LLKENAKGRRQKDIKRQEPHLIPAEGKKGTSEKNDGGPQRETRKRLLRGKNCKGGTPMASKDHKGKSKRDENGGGTGSTTPNRGRAPRLRTRIP